MSHINFDAILEQSDYSASKTSMQKQERLDPGMGLDEEI